VFDGSDLLIFVSEKEIQVVDLMSFLFIFLNDFFDFLLIFKVKVWNWHTLQLFADLNFVLTSRKTILLMVLRNFILILLN
jgi:hypothetical protein